MPQDPPKRRYYLFLLAIVMLVAGILSFFTIGSNSFIIRSASIIAGMAGVYLVRLSNVHGPPAIAGAEQPGSAPDKRAGRRSWLVGAALLAVTGVAFLLLYKDALDGYQEEFPVYLFSATAVVCITYFAYLFSKIFR
jgi:hypothetical protein